MFDIPPQHKDPYLLDPNAGHAWEISGLLGITGDCNGVVAFRLHKILADKMLERSGIEIVMESYAFVAEKLSDRGYSLYDAVRTF